MSAAVHNELKFLMMNRQVASQVPTQGTTPATFEGQTRSGQLQIRNQGCTSFFQGWPSNYHCSKDSASTKGGFNSPPPLLPERQIIPHTAIPSTEYFPTYAAPLLMRQDPTTGGIQLQPNTEAGRTTVPENQNSASLTAVSPTIMMQWNNAVLPPYSQAGQTTVPENLNSASLAVLSPTIMMTENDAVLARSSQARQTTVPENMNSASLPAVPSTVMMAGKNDVLTNEDPGVSLENNLFPNTHNSNLELADPMAYLGRHSSPSDIEPSSPEQNIDEFLNLEAFDEHFNYEDILNSFSFCEPAPYLSPHAGGDTVLNVENANDNTGSQNNVSTSAVPGSAGIQVSGIISSETTTAIGFSAMSSHLPGQSTAAESAARGNGQSIWVDDNGFIVTRPPWV